MILLFGSPPPDPETFCSSFNEFGGTVVSSIFPVLLSLSADGAMFEGVSVESTSFAAICESLELMIELLKT